MKMYERSLIVNILEAKLLESYEDYYPQGQYNNVVINYLYRYIRDNTYTGEHYELAGELIKLKANNELFKNIVIKEDTNKKKFTLTDDTKEISSEMLTILSQLLKKYYNYDYVVISPNRIEFEVKFGWLPPNSASWLNLLNEENLIDYYIDGITLRKNTHSRINEKRPDSGYVCFRINSIKEYDTIMFLYNKELMEIEGINLPKYKIATLLEEIEGSKGATLNRIVEFDLDNFFYELGPYNQNFISADDSSIIIQVPYDYAIANYYYLFDVTNNIKINNKNNANINDPENYFVAFSDPNFEDKFTKYDLKTREEIIHNMVDNDEGISDNLIQYILGDFIWKTSDSKLIAYLQNLINTIFGNSQLKSNGIWSENLSELIIKFKTDNNKTIFEDDVVDKETEKLMLNEYARITNNLDPNENCFNEW